MKRYRAALGPVLVVLLFVVGMRWSPFEPHRPPADPSGAPAGSVSWDDADWGVVEAVVGSVRSVGLDSLGMGDLMARIGLDLVGTPYVPQTLEVEGPERLVVNLRGLDCVTFIENVYVLAALARSELPVDDGSRVEVEAAYERVLQGLRYRNGRIDGYASRLHYFTEWIGDNERKGLLRDVTRELGGVPLTGPVNFMSSHPDAYAQLADPSTVADIRSVEATLEGAPRFYVPEREIAAVSDLIRDGDIIAATSTVDGLDVAHTGLAVRIDGTLRLLHAPLVGEAVQVSERSLADRIVHATGQDGIIVARPIDPDRSPLPDNR